MSLTVGCTLNNSAKNKCVTTSDCSSGNTCVASLCVSLSSLTGDGGGECRESFPPASCQHPDSTYVAPRTPDVLAQALPGRWLFCGNDSTYGGYKFGPPDSIGLEFESDGSWNFVFADPTGVAFTRRGPNSGGLSYEVKYTTVNNDHTQVDVDLHLAESPSTYFLWTQVADSSKRLRMVNLTGGINYYVWAPAPPGCVVAPDMAGSCGATHDMASTSDALFGPSSEPDLSH